MGKRNGVRRGGSIAEKMAGPLESLETVGEGNEIGRGVSIGWRAFTQALEGAILEPGGRTAFAHHFLTPASPLHFLSAYVLFLIISSDAFPAFSGVILRGFSILI